MVHSLKKIDSSKLELTVEIGKEELLEFINETEKGFANELRMEGFRKGKVPRDMMRGQIGEDKIRQESLQMAIESSLSEVLSKEKLDLITQENFSIKENTPEKLLYTVTLVVYPDVKLGEYKGLTLEKGIVEISKEEVAKVLDEVAKSRTVFNVVERPAELGDKVEVDFTIKQDGTVIEGGQSENHPVVLGENKFVVGFEAAVVGMKSGEDKTFNLSIPADYFQKSIAGKQLECHVILKKVEQSTAPVLDDDFAKSLGRFASLSDLEANVQQGLLLEKENKEKERMRLKMVELVAEKSECEIPELLIQQRLESMVSSFDEELHSMGMELGPYLAHIKKTQDDLTKEWRPQALKQVKASLILRAIAKQEQIRVTDEELEEELQIVLQGYTNKKGDIKTLDIPTIKNKIHNLLLNEKVFQLLETSAKIN